MSLPAGHQRLAACIAARASDLLADLRRHVGIPTGLNNASGLDETRGLLTERLGRLGAAIELVPAGPRPGWLHGGPGADPEADRPTVPPPAAVCRRLRPDSGRPRILLSGHLDTVHDPRGPFRELSIATDGKTATGPGCVDMKGGLVIAVAALEALDECGIDASWSFILNSDEETGSYWSEPALRTVAREHDLGLVFEPALPDGSLAIQRPGSGQFMVEVRGRSAHVGRDFASGVSAVNRLAAVLLRLAQLPEPARGKILSVGPLQGGAATNVVPDLAKAWGNVRFKDSAQARELQEQVESLETAPSEVPSVRVFTSFNRPAKPASDAVMKLAGAAREAAESLGQSLPFGSTGGVCDGNILQDEGLPVIDTLGVRGGGLHTPQEWIEIASLVERCQLLALLVATLSEGGSCREPPGAARSGPKVATRPGSDL